MISNLLVVVWLVFFIQTMIKNNLLVVLVERVINIKKGPVTNLKPL